VVVLQGFQGGGIGMAGGGSGLGGLFSARGAEDTLNRTTAILATLFFVTSLALTLLALHGRPEPTSILERQTAPGQAQPFKLPSRAPQPAKPQAPQVPTPH